MESVPETHEFLLRNGVKTFSIERNDAEKALTAECEEFDPFKDRDVDNSTTDCQTLTHLMKSTLGSGIMAMPYAFRASGLVGGIMGGLFMAAICTHTSYILIDCAHILYRKTRKSKMEYAEVVKMAFLLGPKWGRKYANYAKKFVLVWLFLAYFGACVSDNILIANNYGQVIKYYMTNESTAAALAENSDNYSLVRIIMGCLIIPLVLFIWVPDLKYLAPISTIANFFMATVIGITCYYLVQNPKPISQLSLFQPIARAPQFFSITLFAMENIGVMMPLENNMKNPKNFLGPCGVLNKGMFSISLVYIVLGALGYMRYGEKVDTIITTSLPVTDIAAQAVKILIGSTVLLTFSLQFYVCREMVWTRVKKYFPNRPILAEYTIRALLVVICVLIAIALPMISPLVTLVGAFGFSLLGLIFPLVIELIVYWEIGYGRYHWKVYKNVLFIVFGLFCLVFGTEYAINEIATELLNK